MPVGYHSELHRLYIALVACVLAAQEPLATLRVEVIAESGPVRGAEVRASGQALRTGAAGTVTATLAPGKMDIEVTKEGFFPARTSVVLEGGRETAVRVELRAAEEESEEITVYATRTDARIQDAPLRVEVLGQEEIEEKMLMTPGDIVMMLNEMGGMRVQTTSPGLGAASVRVQGMRGRYTRFLSDGLPLFGQQGAGLGLLQIPPMDLGQVEVIKGASSSLYGAGAMAGVVNLISRRPKAEPARELLVNRTTLGGTDLAGFLAGRLQKSWSGSLLGGGHWQDRRDRDGDRWADLAGYGRAIARPRLFWDGGEGRSLLVTGGYTFEQRDGGTLDGAVLPQTGAPYRESLRTGRADLGFNAQTLVGGKYVLTARASSSWQRHGHQFGEVREDDRHDLLFGEVSLRGAAGRHTWVAGAAAERDAYRSRQAPRLNYTFVTPGVFLQDDFRIAPWLSVSASARADFQSEYGTFFSPRVSALVREGGWTSRISYAQGFFAPTPLTEETETAGLTRLAIPRPLSPERSRSFSADLTRSAGPVSLTGTFFASRISRPVHVIRGGGEYRMLNLPEATTNRGVEFLGTFRKRQFALTTSYTYIRSAELEVLGGGRSDVPLTPRHSAGVVGVWEQEGKGRLGVEYYYTGTQRLEYDPLRRSSRPYSIVGVMGERRLAKHVRAFLNLENLTDARQTRWGSLLRPSRAPDGRWTVDAWAPLDGRVINGGLRLLF